jgi:hypothetical protein
LTGINPPVAPGSQQEYDCHVSTGGGKVKKTILVSLVLVLACSGAAATWAEPPTQVQVDALMAKWLWAIGHEYLDGYADCYWPDATVVGYDAAGRFMTLADAKAIRQRQQEWSDQMDYSKIDLSWPEPTRFSASTGDISVCLYTPKQFPGINVFYYQKRGSEVRILRQVELTYPR